MYTDTFIIIIVLCTILATLAVRNPWLGIEVNVSKLSSYRELINCDASNINNACVCKFIVLHKIDWYSTPYIDESSAALVQIIWHNLPL